MAKNISYGAKGSDVKKIQQALIKAGYDVGSSGADGSFGPATQAAIKKYQKDNGLKVDGIVGTNTWGSLFTTKTPTTPKNNNKNNNKNNKTTTTTTPKAPTLPTYQTFDPSTNQTIVDADTRRQEIAATKPGEFTYDEYVASDIVNQANAMLQQHIANKPGEYSSTWQSYIDETLDKILNREKFTYDINGDPLYQQYKDQYDLQGLKGMMNTMGQAQAMTGGYGNSYAQSVGQQTYQGYLQQLNDRIPELYQIARDQYNQETQNLYNQYGIFADRENQDYGRYRDTLSDWQNDRSYLTDEARYQSETDYNRHMDYKNFEYGMYRDSVDDYRYEQGRADEEYWKLYDIAQTEHGNKFNYDYNSVVDSFNIKNTLDQQNLSQQNTAKADAKETVMSMVSLGVMPSVDLLKAAGMSKADAKKMVNKVKEEAKKSSSTSGSGSGGGGKVTNPGKTGSGYDNGGYDDATVKQVQKFLGVSQDGKFGPASQAAAKAAGYNSIAEVVKAMGDDKPVYKVTPAVTSFIASIRTPSEFARGSNSDNQKYKTYQDYVKGMLEKYEGNLTDNDIATIWGRLGFK